jgi:NADPH-dependent 2,4-dienoyl-CoA reductase/sulfur reductase-like enzyme/nitrite reductase/ring-hydroxylating ferredoxin subunit
VTAHDDELTGPDLTAGVEISSVAPGQLIAGHAFGEPVLLIRGEPNWFAVGAKCTHYGAPLDQGVVLNDSIRCPWHHACFELHNGAASRAPALNDLPSYDVSVESNIVRVLRKRDHGQIKGEPHRPRSSRAPERVLLESTPTTGPSSVVIIGGGAAGNACAEMLRREAYRGPITIIDSDPDAPYDRPNLSKDYLAGNALEEWLPLHPPDFYSAQRIEIISGVEVRAIDTKSKTVELGNGESRQYDRLLIATGASPIRLDVPGAERIMYLRSLRDCRSIIDSLAGASSAAVIGASFIGLEVAASLRLRGLKVSVIAPEPLPLARVLGADLGSLIQRVHQERGVTFCLGSKVTGIEKRAVVLDDGRRVEADIVVAGVGVRPNLRLAESAGLMLDNGIAVDEFLETSVSGVYAAGDVARWPDAYSDVRLRIEHWVVAERQGQVAALNMLGHRDRFDDIPFFWSNHYETLSIQYVGHADRWDETRIDGDVAKMDCAVSYLKDGKRTAMATINRDRENLRTEMALETELLMKPPSNITVAPAEA